MNSPFFLSKSKVIVSHDTEHNFENNGFQVAASFVPASRLVKADTNFQRNSDHDLRKGALQAFRNTSKCLQREVGWVAVVPVAMFSSLLPSGLGNKNTWLGFGKRGLG